MPRSATMGMTSLSSIAPTEEDLFPASPVAWKPRAKQKEAVKFLLEHAAAGLFADPGAGKTSIVYAAFKILKKAKKASKMLVVAPRRPANLVWPLEQQKWLDFADLKVVLLHGHKKDELLSTETETADVLIVTPEGLDWLFKATRVKNARGRISVKVDLKKFKKLGVDILVVDELTKFKNAQSGRFKILKSALHLFGRRWGLTGSPAANGLLDLFGQCYVLDMGKALGQYISHYRSTYFVPTFDGFGYDLLEGSEERIYDRVAPLILRIGVDDHPDMPGVLPVERWGVLPPEARRVYDELEEDMFTKLGDGRKVTATTASTVSGKCQQIAAGGLYVEPDVLEMLGRHGVTPKKTDREWVNLHSEKTEMLADLVEELQGQPLFVGYHFHHDLDRLKAKFGDDVPIIGGGTSDAESLRLEALWNRGKIPLLFGHPQSVGHGLNLQGAGNHVAWHSMTWDYELYDQFIRRVRRLGSKHNRVFVHHLLMRDTVDESMLWAVRGKDHAQRRFFEALMARKKRR